MLPRRALRLLALALCLATLAVVDGQGPGGAAALNASAAGLVAATSPLPGVGTRIETCIGGGRTLAGCSRWVSSGPINVVLLSQSPESPYVDALAETRPRWQPAQGGWLVARLPTRGCGAGWHASEQQAELRLNAVERRHFKFIRPGCRWHGLWLTVGEAHTDLYDVRRCGGDHMADLDLARDALVASLTAGGYASRVEYLRWNAPGTTFPDGCGHRIATDGLVAYVWLHD